MSNASSLLPSLYNLCLIWFLYNLETNICRNIQKIESLVRQQGLPISQKIYNMIKRLKTPEEFEKYFPGFLAFIDSQQIPRSKIKWRGKYAIPERRKDIGKDFDYG